MPKKEVTMKAYPIILSALIALVLLGISSCVAPWQLMRCDFDNDCPDGLLCREDRCVSYQDLPGETVISDSGLQPTEAAAPVAAPESPAGEEPAALPPNICALDSSRMACSIVRVQPGLFTMLVTNNLTESVIIDDVVFSTKTPQGEAHQLCQASRAQGKKVYSMGQLEFDVDCPLQPYVGTILSGTIDFSITKGYYASGQSFIETWFAPGSISGTYSFFVNEPEGQKDSAEG
ncbi:hypothetical protein HYU19_04350 [Candidatus Woesearchaeota archaeon]|nr:hypothetical protein [Candidatus Woesearchaeota archaeon]